MSAANQPVTAIPLALTVGLVLNRVQVALGIPPERQAANMGPITKGLLNYLDIMPKESPYAPPILSEAMAAKVADLATLNPDGQVRRISVRGASFIKLFEGLVLTASDDGGGVATVGWGHTGLLHDDGTVYIGRKITVEKAEQLFRYDMEQFEASVCSLVKVPVNDDQFAALVSFDFNTGGLKKSTLLKKLNAGDEDGAVEEFGKWNKDNGNPVAGLTRRRASEVRLWFGVNNPVFETPKEAAAFLSTFKAPNYRKYLSDLAEKQAKTVTPSVAAKALMPPPPGGSLRADSTGTTVDSGPTV